MDVPSAMLWGTLAVLFIAGVYIAGHLLKPKTVDYDGATFAQKHTALIVVLAIVIPIAVGVALANTAFSDRSVVKKRVDKATPVGMSAPVVHIDPPEPVLKMVISDGSKEVDIATLNRCRSDEVTIIENSVVVCQNAESPQVKAWMQDVRVQEKRLLKKYLAHQKAQHTPPVMAPQKKTPRTMQQSFGWFAPAKPPAPDEKIVKEKKPFRDRHAEVFFFLALVLGVLSKYFWDFYEERRQGKEGTFEPHVIVMSFIISALVYYSIQQGLEKEAGKLTTRGILFAFNNGFMWQTILKSTRLSNGSAKPSPANEQPSQ